MNIPKSTQLMAAMVVNHMRHEWVRAGTGDYREAVLELAKDFERRAQSKTDPLTFEAYDDCARALRAALKE